MEHITKLIIQQTDKQTHSKHRLLIVFCHAPFSMHSDGVIHIWFLYTTRIGILEECQNTWTRGVKEEEEEEEGEKEEE